ncbi:Kelch-like protein 5, partial [Halocaridina rubra]
MANASCCDDDDVYLVADDRRFKCSKRKLIASSDYFRAMFTSNFREKDKEAIQLQDVDAEYLETLLQYIQHGTYSINENNALGLLQTASMLQFTDVQEACKKEICEFLSCESCLEIYSISSSLGLLDIAVSARTIALWNFPKIATMPHFLHCSVDTLFDYLSDSALHTGPSGEWTVWEAIALWIEENELERPDSVMKLLHCLDFKLLSADDISNMLFYSVISDNDEAVQLLESIKRYKNNPSLLSDVCLRNEQVLLGSNNSTCKIHEVELNNRNIYLNSITRKPALVPSAVGFKRQCLKRNKKKK